MSYLAAAGKGSLQFDFGKFVTPAGFEVIESKDNWNYSRGLLYWLAIPLYHQGLRVAYSPNDRVSLTGFVFNGWNNSVDNNTGKSIGVSLSFKPNPALMITENYIGGPEATGDNGDWRHLSDTIVTYTVNSKVSVAANYDWATDHSLSPAAVWQGIATYVKFQANSWFAVAPRYEYFKDRDGFTTGTPQNLQDLTLTAEFNTKTAS